MVTNSWVIIALRAPRTLNRCLPEWALRNNRVKHQRYPKKGAKTKWAASTKNTVLFPSLASFSMGSKVFKGFLFINVGFRGIVPTLRWRKPIFLRNFLTCFSLRLSPVSFSTPPASYSLIYYVTTLIDMPVNCAILL